MELTRLADVPVRAVNAVMFWRHAFLPADPHAQDPLWVTPEVGRWRSPEGALYLADSETTMWCEYLRNTAAQAERADPTGGLALAGAFDVRALATQALVEMPPRGVWRVSVHLARVADLTSAAAVRALRRAGVHPGALLADDYGPCPDIAALHAQLEWHGLISQSAALPERHSVAVFKPHFPAPDRFQLRHLAAQPTVLHAALTRFRNGERPTWLPPRERLIGVGVEQGTA
jgi:hypothetical protein